MKLKNLICSAVAGVALAASCFTAEAQLGFDTFTPIRIIPFGVGALNKGIATNNFTTGVAVTNGPIDRVNFFGKSQVLIYVNTNTPTAFNLSAQIFGSSDTTNFTAITNFAQVTNYTAFALTGSTVTNIVTNQVVLPGILTTPSATANLFAGNYLAPLSQTNTVATTLQPGWNSIAFTAQDQFRYLYIVYTPVGTNINASAVFIGTPIQPNTD